VRYADDFVVLARTVSPKLRGFIEAKLETWAGREINREKRRVADLRPKGVSLDFPGFTFRCDRSRFGVGRYLSVAPSKKALKRERERWLEADPGLDRRAESAPARLGGLLSLRLFPRRFRSYRPII
jgi:RNA-directed DNA polymerase